MYSCCGSSIGNRRISSRYRERPPSAVTIGRAATRAILAPSIFFAPGGPAGSGAAALMSRQRLESRSIATAVQHRVRGVGLKVNFLSPRRDPLPQPKYLIEHYFFARSALEFTHLSCQAISQTGEIGRQFRAESQQ